MQPIRTVFCVLRHLTTLHSVVTSAATLWHVLHVKCGSWPVGYNRVLSTNQEFAKYRRQKHAIQMGALAWHHENENCSKAWLWLAERASSERYVCNVHTRIIRFSAYTKAKARVRWLQCCCPFHFRELGSLLLYRSFRHVVPSVLTPSATLWTAGAAYHRPRSMLLWQAGSSILDDMFNLQEPCVLYIGRA